MPSTAMLAAHQGQNRSRGWPFRSASEMTLMPFCSTDSVSLGRTATSVAIASPSELPTAERARMLLPARGAELLELVVGRAGGRPGSGHGIGCRADAEEDGVRPGQSSRQPGQAGADMDVAGAAGIHRLHADRRH